MFFVGEVTETVPDIIEQPDSENEWFLNLPINGSNVEFKKDTGMDTTVMSQAEIRRLPHCPQLVIANRGSITSPVREVECIGKFLATSEHKEQKYKFWVTVIKGLYSHNLMGSSVASRMGLVIRVNCMDTVGYWFAQL